MRLSESKRPNRLVSLALPLLSLFVVCPIAAEVNRSHPPPHAGCPRGDPGPLPVLTSLKSTALTQTKPLPAPARWRGLIGEYGPDDDTLIILEKDGKLCASFKRAELEPLDRSEEH